MPTYVYRCPKCTKRMDLSRRFDEMDDPAECLDCGTAVERVFAPPTDIFVPVHMKSVLTGGKANGGGGLSWSDFHGDSTEKDLASDPRVVPAAQHRSQAGIIKSR